MQVLPNRFNAPTMDPFEAWTTPEHRARVAAEAQREPTPPAVVRPFEKDKDLKLVRYLVGAGIMEPSSLANSAALFQPLSLLACLALGHVLIIYTSGYPSLLHNFLYPATPKAVNADATILQTITDSVLLIPLLVAPPIAILAAFEWRHRNLFEDEMRRAIGEEDLRDIPGYYGAEGEKDEQKKAQRQGLWVLEYDARLIGAVSLDGRKPGQALDSVVDHPAPSRAGNKKAEDASAEPSSGAGSSTATSSTSDASLRARTVPSLSVTPPAPASPSSSHSLPDGTLHLRRLATSLSFRSAGIETDLLAFVAAQAFSPSPVDAKGEPRPSAAVAPPASAVVTTLRPKVQTKLRKTLEKAGWEAVPRGSELEVSSSSAAAKKGGLVDRVWPLDLSERTYVLRRSTWEKQEKARELSAAE
ncbi:hypothetical protein JCM10213_000483 [Rhodosporidiobolus nylandii]